MAAFRVPNSLSPEPLDFIDLQRPTRPPGTWRLTLMGKENAQKYQTGPNKNGGEAFAPPPGVSEDGYGRVTVVASPADEMVKTPEAAEVYP